MTRRTPALFALGLLSVVLLVTASACEEDALGAPIVEAPLLSPPLVPPPTLENGQRVAVHLEAVETQMEIAPGVTTTAWTFNGTVPGPMIRVRVGDQVEIHLKNSIDSEMSHNIDLHAVNGPGGGAGATTVAPGEEASFSFKATTAGLFVYHCAAGIVADHIANGMYGAILVDPPTGTPNVDHEFYVGQSDFYTEGDTGDPGHHELDSAKLFAETPNYVLFNGHTKSLAGDHALKADTGETVRIYFANGGPNLASSFHVIGEIFDKVWDDGALESTPRKGVQTVLVPPGGGLVVDFELDVPGDYKLVDHAISRVSKGAVGTLTVGGDDDLRVFRPMNGNQASASSHDMTPPETPSPAPSATTTAEPPPANGASSEVTVDMADSVFNPSQLTVAAGSEVKFLLPNSGKLPHNMRIATADGEFDGSGSAVSAPEIINGGKSGTLTWTAEAPGSYEFRCDVHPAQMTGTIIVE